ncbi:MAG TPA: IS200/IS605 family transposase [Myxococcales bacterium]|nr:IS200/IS605 family transposase [Myxococcales bacterium]
MGRYRRGGHTVYELHCHFVFTTKHSEPVLRGDVGVRLRELVREVCRARDIRVLKGRVKPEHVHLFASLPPHLAPAEAMRAIKRKSARKLLREFPRLKKQLRGEDPWSRGYFVSTRGDVTDEVVAQYVMNQDLTSDDEDFEVSE